MIFPPSILYYWKKRRYAVSKFSVKSTCIYWTIFFDSSILKNESFQKQKTKKKPAMP